ncbi:N5-carboxyaminoimidazole ribonucleotide synthase [Pullulanibacillus camelliae]|uniref:N5-carboxyaminoimidazole ribonucleotide synthase n=1 Tax=Pullulanibacillus camelliae TaxID=1707096 RepID=A0A8J2YGJ7_9BACL|nr:5-(carboxyamino)imidazole ribonucleotide synthase [Pullulanibacillus camelliae]GGE35694.1 N5-carboxyaminoimidazole ribonucleotide synthase [Pullulanibacillus camelliae]
MKQPMIIPGQTIGILGGGQLGRMMALSARAMGYRIAVLDPGHDNPLSQVADIAIQTAYDDPEGAERLADVSDVITYEFENVDLAVARQLEAKDLLPQGSGLLAVTQDRVNEKKALSKAGVKIASYEVIQTQEQLEKALQIIGYPSVLKTARGGYDGKGQLVIRRAEDMDQARALVDGTTVFVLEQWVPFQKELSIMIARSTQGEIKTFPVVENIHIHNILHQTIAPARISERVKSKAEQMALEISESLNLVGMLGVEMFMTADEEVYVNELAPRPHNSGHYTIEACETSQFEQHIRAICGWPLGSTEQLKPATMLNLLGQHMEAALTAIPQMANSHFHLYGKDEAKQNRKMGHITLLADTLDEALQRAEQLKIWNQENVEVTK